MKRVGEFYEVVVFIVFVFKVWMEFQVIVECLYLIRKQYGDLLFDQLDIYNVVYYCFFCESCYNYQGNYVKDLL